jgi:CRP-like cAMP-binding protein/sugar phosphate isomerase/epimerase
MDDILKTVTSQTDREAVQKVLDASLNDKDPYCSESRMKLSEIGLPPDSILRLLAHHKSRVKYGYDLSATSISHLLDLSNVHEKGAVLKRLFEYPFLLVKACWLYDHAPHFIFYGEDKPGARDAFILKFAEQYETLFLNNRVSPDAWKKIKNPRRITATKFWEGKIIDPVQLIEKAMEDNIEGVELSFDFHPFNFTKLLPEELTEEQRSQIKAASLKSGIKLSIHSPIVGPYVPFPDPSKGNQRFFDPTQCLEVQYDTVELAKDIGADTVVCHLIDPSNLKAFAGLVEKAEGSSVRVTIENYCQTPFRQTSGNFISCVDEIFNLLPREIRKNNFGITLDVGHLNIEGEDPLVGSERIGKWCLDKNVFLRVHATDNYGNLLFSPPAFSADVHGNISGRGINNALIIKMLRSMGHHIDVVGEQIQSLTEEDIATVHEAQSASLNETYEAFAEQGKEKLSGIELGALIEPHIVEERAYQFLAGIQNVSALREHLIFRKIQEKKHLSVDEAKRISQEFMRMPQTIKKDVTQYIDDLLLPIQAESGAIQKSELDLICQNISGALFGTIRNEHLNQIFSNERAYLKDDIICKQGSAGHEMFYIKDGEVTVYVDGSLVASLGPGEIFGEMSLFYNINKSATVKVSGEKVKLGILSREGLESLFTGGQYYARDLIFRLYTILPERLRNLNNKYKTAIRSLHLIFDGDEKKMPSLDHELADLGNKKSEFFPTLSQDDKDIIFEEIRNFDPGQPIFTQGDLGDGAYFILEGKVKVVGISENFKEILLGEVNEGDTFGEMSLIDDKPRSASVVTLTPCKAAFISKKTFNEFIASGSESAFRFMGSICFSLFMHILRLDRLYSDVKKKIDTSVT